MLTSQTLTYILPCLIAWIAVLWVHPKVLRLAKMKHLVDNPDARKLQKEPVPVLGGIAVFLGLLTGAITYVAMTGDTSFMIIMLVAGVMLYTGSLDDILSLTPCTRFVIETLTVLALIYATGMCVDDLHGLWGIDGFTWYAAIPLTILMGVGVINATNMVDGVNGLSSGLCIMSSLLFGTVFLMRGDTCNAVLAFCMTAALLPFFVHNVWGKRSRMFIGDGGTMVMGILVTWFVIRLLSGQMADNDGRTYNPAALALAIELVPVADTLRVMGGRVLRGCSPFRADKTHLHHAFIAAGVSHCVTALLEITLNLLAVGIYFIALNCGMGIDAQLYLVIGLGVVLVWGPYIFIHTQEVHKTLLWRWMLRANVHTHLSRTNWWQAYQRWLDGKPDPKLDEESWD